MNIIEIITEKQLPFEEERIKVNEILTNLFDSKQKELEKALEEDCVVSSPLTYMQHHGGIDSTYYFGTNWGTVKVYIGDCPEDSKVEFLENQILGLINKPVETVEKSTISKMDCCPCGVSIILSCKKDECERYKEMTNEQPKYTLETGGIKIPLILNKEVYKSIDGEEWDFKLTKG